MTVEEIKAAIERIKSADGDYERQHSWEDDLVWSYVRHLAEHGNAEAVELLKCRALDFERHCA